MVHQDPNQASFDDRFCKWAQSLISMWELNEFLKKKPRIQKISKPLAKQKLFNHQFSPAELLAGLRRMCWPDKLPLLKTVSKQPMILQHVEYGLSSGFMN